MGGKTASWGHEREGPTKKEGKNGKINDKINFIRKNFVSFFALFHKFLDLFIAPFRCKRFTD